MTELGTHNFTYIKSTLLSQQNAKPFSQLEAQEKLIIFQNIPKFQNFKTLQIA